jgi:ABC-type dipeptide/oligopeptide/nickel transport system ATPase component
VAVMAADVVAMAVVAADVAVTVAVADAVEIAATGAIAETAGSRRRVCRKPSRSARPYSQGVAEALPKK